MNIVEKEATEFYEYEFINSGLVNTLENLRTALNTKLWNFYRDRDKLDFLKILRTTCAEDIENHINGGCVGCGYEEPRNLAIFTIEQEIEKINKNYSFEPKKEEVFSSKEESELHSKLNHIIDELKKQGFGQQIIFEEIEDLKDHFNLGKKTWFQLLKGKLIDLTIEKALEKTVIVEIYKNLSEGYEHFTKMIG
jgi:hypothetical protein